MLNDVAILRLLLIVLLVVYHSFCIFSGAWSVPDNYLQIPAYGWIAKASYSFMLETFVFISGYLYGYQIRKKGISNITIKNTLIRKAKRLLLPCFFFGIIYYWMFYDLGKPIHDIIYTILNGVGHLWFLPMLFWCFVGIYAVEKIRLSLKITLLLAVIMALCPFLPFPLRLTSTMYYFLFFYVGYCINRYSWNIKRFFTPRVAMLSSGLWLTFFTLFAIINNMG